MKKFSISNNTKKKLIGSVLSFTILASEVLIPNNMVSAKKSLHSTSNKIISEWKNNDKVAYPITTDDEKWKSLKSHDEMIQKTTIPNELLKTTSTDELINLALEYPLLCDLFAYDTPQQGLEALMTQNPVIKEIMEREDGATKLIEEYKNINITKEINTKSRKNIDDTYISLGQELLQVTLLESMLAQDEVLDTLDDTHKDELLDSVYTKIDEKNDSSVYEGSSVTNFFNTLSKDNSLYKSSVKATSRATLVVKTPKGSNVPVIKNTFYGYYQSSAITKSFKNAYPNATVKAFATNMYNCHSYAWYSTKQYLTSGFWMDNPSCYISDGSYKKVGSKPTANQQKVSYILVPYKNPYEHSGIVTNYSKKTILSKWGQGPLVEHSVSYSPYKGSPTYYQYYK